MKQKECVCGVTPACASRAAVVPRERLVARPASSKWECGKAAEETIWGVSQTPHQAVCRYKRTGARRRPGVGLGQRRLWAGGCWAEGA